MSKDLTSVKLDLSKNESIPKIVHLSWKNKNILQDKSPVILNGLANIIKLNPGYRIEISDDNDVETYLKAKLKRWDYIKIKNKKIVEKIDLWRLLKMYYEGGIYVDIDRYCNIPFDEVILPQTKCILPTYGDVDFSQDLMITCKHNPIFRKAIDYNLSSRFLINPRGVFHLGPPIYMRAVTETVFGKHIKRNPKEGVMQSLRQALKKSEFFQTYKETLPNDSLIFKYNAASFQKGNGLNKEDFYKSQNVTPWNYGFDKNTLYLIMIFIILIFGIVIYTF